MRDNSKGFVQKGHSSSSHVNLGVLVVLPVFQLLTWNPSAADSRGMVLLLPSEPTGNDSVDLSQITTAQLMDGQEALHMVPECPP